MIDIIMMVLFLALFIISIMKLKPFLQTRELVDDDTTKESIQTLDQYIFKALDTQENKELSFEELFEKIKALEEFDAKHFWRLTPHKLRNHVNEFYAQNSCGSLTQMHQVMHPKSI